jgi:hypothetical protein
MLLCIVQVSILHALDPAQLQCPLVPVQVRIAA